MPLGIYNVYKADHLVLAVDSKGKGDGEDLGGVWGGETIIRTYYMKNYF